MIHLRFVLPCGLPVGAIVAFHQSPLPHSQYGTNYCTIERTRADVNGILGSKSTYMGNWPHFLPVSPMGCCNEQSWCNAFVQSLRCCSFDRRKGRFLLRPERQQICPHTASPPPATGVQHHCHRSKYIPPFTPVKPHFLLRCTGVITYVSSTWKPIICGDCWTGVPQVTEQP